MTDRVNVRYNIDENELIKQWELAVENKLGVNHVAQVLNVPRSVIVSRIGRLKKFLPLRRMEVASRNRKQRDINSQLELIANIRNISVDQLVNSSEM